MECRCGDVLGRLGVRIIVALGRRVVCSEVGLEVAVDSLRVELGLELLKLDREDLGGQGQGRGSGSGVGVREYDRIRGGPGALVSFSRASMVALEPFQAKNSLSVTCSGRLGLISRSSFWT